jgi:hypothetical protein
MSEAGNIFYSNVDPVLQRELNSRGEAGRYNKSEASMNFMHGKIANVQATAYDTTSSKSEAIGVLGGSNVRTGRYLPSGTDTEPGYLDNATYTTKNIVFKTDGDNIIGAYTETNPGVPDTTNRIGPYIKDVSIAIGDHSMGLLNTATLKIVIPNPQRYLDTIEDIWFRPGRYVKLEIHHPESAVVTGKVQLSDKSLPNREKLKELHPEWPVDDLLKEISRLNVFNFEGLITTFEFSYDSSLQVEASITLRGTSNSYTDISMYLPPVSKQQETQQQRNQQAINSTNNAGLNGNILTEAELEANTPPKYEFYDALYNIIDTQIKKVDPTGTQTQPIIIPFTPSGKTGYSDCFIVAGQPYLATVNDAGQADLTNEIRAQSNLQISQLNISNAQQLATASAAISKSAEDRIKFIQDEQQAEINSYYHRYITLGCLIDFINTYVLSQKISVSISVNKKLQQKPAEIHCTVEECVSNYLPYLTSCDPDNILLLPSGNSVNDMNAYGTTVYFESVANNNIWPGVYNKTSVNPTGVLYPSRILINLTLIQKIVDAISRQDTRNFTVNTFLSVLSGKINYATGGAITMNLVTEPVTQTALLYTDTKCLKTPQTKLPIPESVNAYSIPMGANHKFGSVVKNFTFSATLPKNAQALSYVLNQGKEVSEYEIAPYINFMYNSKDSEKITQTIATYKQKNIEAIEKLQETKKKLGLSPREPQFMQALYSALNTYVKYPTGNIKQSQVMIAPIFPFTTEFTIDGINGFRYGDVLTFDVLPLKYRVNTVFSVMGITHNVGEKGIWETTIKCIQRPKID